MFVAEVLIDSGLASEPDPLAPMPWAQGVVSSNFAAPTNVNNWLYANNGGRLGPKLI